jgi:S-DNA-T family DNA segregation ATPase FtsK/SpoIIIE
VRAVAGGHAGRLMIWVADDDPYIGPPHPSPLIGLDEFSVWEPIPFGRDARGRRITLVLIWQSMFFGGLPRRGKTFAQRLPSAAGVLDPYVRHYVADGKGGADWRPMRAVAHRLVIGAEDEAISAFLAMLDELITEMGHRFALLGGLPTSICPEGKLTPDISRRYDLPVVFITIDELQEYLTAMTSAVREEAVDKLARLARRGPAAGFVLNAASQRPDTDSVPAKLREIITYRYCTQVVDRTSSDMVLGKGKAAQGADASILSEDHKGVGVLVTGPGSFDIVRCDYMDLPAFAKICALGRALRIAAGTLTGDAATDAVAAAEAAGAQIPAVLADVLYAMHGLDRMHTTTLLARLTNMDEDTYAEFSPERLAEQLERAGVRRTGRQVKVDGINLAGYRRADLEAALPPGATLPPRQQPATDGDR